MLSFKGFYSKSKRDAIKYITFRLICPSTTFISPSIADIRLDFPAPTCPTMAISWAVGISKLMLSEANNHILTSIGDELELI